MIYIIKLVVEKKEVKIDNYRLKNLFKNVHIITLWNLLNKILQMFFESNPSKLFQLYKKQIYDKYSWYYHEAMNLKYLKF